MTADVKTSTSNRTARLLSFGWHDVLAIGIWAYVILKLFIIDLDVVAMQALFPSASWILNYKSLVFLALFAALLLIVNRTSAAFAIAFVTLYPLLVLFWRIPRFILGRRSWVLAFAALNLALGVARSFRRIVIVAASLLISTTVCIAASGAVWLYFSAAVLCLTVLYLYARALLSVFRTPAIYAAYEKVLPAIRVHVVSQNRLDPSLKAIPAQNRNDVQNQEWANKLNTPVLTNRIYLFLSRRFSEYQNSPAPYTASLALIAFLFVVTTLSFAAINYALYRADTISYDVSSGSFFSFIWYSFNAILFNAIKEVAPQSPIAQSVWMLEASLALFLIAILIGLFFSIKSQRNASQLEKVVSALESESRELELFIQAEYEIGSVDEAIAELERLRLGLFQVLLWLTKNMK